MQTFTDFTISWIKTGFEWYKEDPKNITGWRFGHDWNNDYSYKSYQSETHEATVPKISYRIKDAMCAIVQVLIIHTGEWNEDIDRLIKYLQGGSDLSHFKDITIRELGYAMKQLLIEAEPAK